MSISNNDNINALDNIFNNNSYTNVYNNNNNNSNNNQYYLSLNKSKQQTAYNNNKNLNSNCNNISKDIQTLQHSNISSKSINRINSNQNNSSLLKQIYNNINSNTKITNNPDCTSNRKDSSISNYVYNNQVVSNKNLNISSNNNKDEIICSLNSKVLELEAKLKLLDHKAKPNNICFSPKNQIPKNLTLKNLTNKELLTRALSNEKKSKPIDSSFFNFEAKLRSVKQNEKQTKDNFFLFNDWKKINFNSIETFGKAKDINKVLSNSKDRKKADLNNLKLNKNNNNNINKHDNNHNNNLNNSSSNKNANKLLYSSNSNNNLNFKSIDNCSIHNNSNYKLLKSEDNINSNRIITFDKNINLISDDNLLIVGSSNNNNNVSSKNKIDFSFNNSLLYSGNKKNNKDELADSHESLNYKKSKTSFINQDKKKYFFNSSANNNNNICNKIFNNQNDFMSKENSFFSEKGKSVKKAKESSSANAIYKPIIPKNSKKKNLYTNNNSNKLIKNNNSSNTKINNNNTINSNSINISINTPKNLANFSGKFNSSENEAQLAKKDNIHLISNSISDENLCESQINKNFKQMKSINSNISKSKYSNISFELAPTGQKDKSISTKKDENVTEDKTNVNSNTELSVSLIKQFRKKSFLFEEIQNDEKNENTNFHNQNKAYNTNYINYAVSDSINAFNSNYDMTTKHKNKFDNSSLNKNITNDSFGNQTNFNTKINNSNTILSKSQNLLSSNINNSIQRKNKITNQNNDSDNFETVYLQTDFGIVNKMNNYYEKKQIRDFKVNYSNDKSSDNNFTNTFNQNNTFNYEEEFNKDSLNNDLLSNLETIKLRAKIVFEKYNKSCLALKNIIEKRSYQ